MDANRFAMSLVVLLCGVCLVSGAQNAAAPAQPAQPSVEPAPEIAPSLQVVSPDLLKGLETYWRPEEPAEANALPLTIEESVRLALDQNPQILTAQDQIAEAQAQVSQAKAARRPSLTADVSFVHLEPINKLSLTSIAGGGGGGGLFSLLIPEFEIEKDFRRDHANLSQVFFAGGQIKAAVAASKHLEQSQEWRKQAAINDLEYQTKQAYYNVLMTRALIRVADEAVTTFNRHLADTKQMLDVGLVSNFELLRAQTELNSRQSNLVTARNAQRLALANLHRVLALPQDRPLQLVSDLDLRPVGETLDALMKEALEKRPELLALEKAVAASEQNVKRAKGAYWPKAAGAVDYLNNSAGMAKSQSAWTFSATAQLDIYSGGKKKAQVAEAKSKLSNLEHQKIDVGNLVQLDVQQSFIQTQNALAKINEDKGTVDLAREGRRLAELRYQEGVGTQVEMLDAELALTSAETTLVQDFRDYATARAALDKAVGRGPQVADLEK